MRSGKYSTIYALFAMFMYMFCGLSLFLLFQNHFFAHAAIFPDTHDITAQGVIRNEKEASKDKKFKSAAIGFTISQFFHPDNKEKKSDPPVSVFLKQVDSLRFSMRSPPINRS